MSRYEWKVEIVDTPILEETLNRFDENGFEILTVVPTGPVGFFAIITKRPLKS